MTIRLTDEHLAIPHRMAIAFSRSLGTTAHEDDLLCEGNLALVEAAAAYDPAMAHDSTDSFDYFAMRRVQWACKTYLRGLRLHESRTETGYDLSAVESAAPAGMGAAEWMEHLAHPLSERQREVFVLLAAGSTTIEISEKLGISVGAVRTARAAIQRKLQPLLRR